MDLSLIAKESKQSVKILKYVSYNQGLTGELHQSEVLNLIQQKQRAELGTLGSNGKSHVMGQTIQLPGWYSDAIPLLVW